MCLNWYLLVKLNYIDLYLVLEKIMRSDKEEEKSKLELKEKIKQLKKRIKDLERERDILLALHRRDYES